VRVLSTARDLQRRHARERQGLFVAEGIRAVEELLRSPLVVRGALVVDDGEHTRRRAIVATLRDRGIPVEDVSATDFASASDTETPQGILAIAEIPKRGLATLTLPNLDPVRLVVLDAVQDPGNVGTILRTASALGAVATLALPGTVDLWNAKVVRSSMGALFHHPALGCTWEELGSFLSKWEIALWGAENGGEPLSAMMQGASPVPRRVAVAVGNEGGGLSAHVRAGAVRLVAVEIEPGVESLNVGVATGIMLYELRRLS
jgi:RNA methyltransferase, TrmH family